MNFIIVLVWWFHAKLVFVGHQWWVHQQQAYYYCQHKIEFVWFLLTLWFLITKWICLHILFLIELSRQEHTNSCRHEFQWLHRKKQLLHAVTHFTMYNSVFLEYSTFQRSSSSCEAVVGSKKNLFCAVSLRTAVSGPAFPY